MHYETLGDADFVQLRRERLTRLESEHYATKLVLAETVDPDEVERLNRILDELNQRIEVHTGETAPVRSIDASAAVG